MNYSWIVEREPIVKVKGALIDRNLEFMVQMPEEQLQVFVDTLIEKGGITETLSASEDYKEYGKTILNIGIELKKNIEILVVIPLIVFFLVQIHIDKS